MATRVKDGPPGKAPTLPRSSSSKSVTSKDQKQDSTSSEKHIPNYLKPTRSSSGIDHQSVKKKPSAFSSSTSTDDASHKPSLTRRRSFDKPPPTTQAAKTTRISSSSTQKPMLDRRRSFDRPPPPQVQKARVLTQSASSSSIKPTMISSQKGLQDLLLKSPKAPGEKKSLVRRTVSIKKGSNGGKNQENEKLKGPVNESNDGVDKPDIANIPEDGNPQSLVSDEEITIYSLSDNEMLADIVEEEHQEHIDPIQPEVHIQEPEDIKLIESSAVPAEQDAQSDVKTEETEVHNSITEEKSDTILESEQNLANNSVDSTNENLAAEPEDQEKGVVENENEASDKKEEVDDGIQKETEEVKVAVEEVKKEAQKVAPKREPPVQAKRESAVSNDVIEETASKLREQRKNKVKALAGAFETVISLQDPK